MSYMRTPKATQSLNHGEAQVCRRIDDAAHNLVRRSPWGGSIDELHLGAATAGPKLRVNSLAGCHLTRIAPKVSGLTHAYSFTTFHGRSGLSPEVMWWQSVGGLSWTWALLGGPRRRVNRLTPERFHHTRARREAQKWSRMQTDHPVPAVARAPQRCPPCHHDG
jgi:hypothetical protein